MGPARDYCKEGDAATSGGGGGGGGWSVDDSAADPLKALAKGCAEGASWIVDRLSDAVAATGTVNFADAAFVQRYAITFAAAAFLVILMWLWAVIKRVVRGVPFTRALGEAIGLLWLAVIASAFTPLLLQVVVSAVDGITDALAGGGGGAKFFQAYSDALKDQQGTGGAIMQIILSLVSILSAGVVWLELVMRTALLYVGAALGTVVYAGLVDKELWGRVRRWVGMMAAVILVKPIIVIVLSLASGMSSGRPTDKPTGALVSGLAIIVITIIASAMIFKMLPGMGDDIVAARQSSYDAASRQSLAAVTKPVGIMRQGINTHAARESQQQGQSSAVSSSVSSTASSGISTHGTRRPSPRTSPEAPASPRRPSPGSGSQTD
ncbi:hypothetical protein [Streptomyces sp. NPDC087307]|uniref:hypothetical protein n=1 Tax=Streptomyces sp. NPDC087307 TaxID=3365782 RepID=UPI0037F55E4E